MSKTVEESRLNKDVSATIRNSLNCSDWAEFSETINSVLIANDSPNLDCSVLSWFSDAQSQSSSDTLPSPQVSPARADEDEGEIARLQNLNASKFMHYWDFLEGNDSDWEIKTEYDPREYTEERLVPTSDCVLVVEEQRSRSSCELYDNTLFSGEANITKRSAVMIKSLSRTMNYLLEQESLEMDVPKSPTNSLSSDTAFTLSSESELEMREQIDNIVQTLNITDSNEPRNGSKSASAIIPIIIDYLKNDKQPVVDIRNPDQESEIIVNQMDLFIDQSWDSDQAVAPDPPVPSEEDSAISNKDDDEKPVNVKSSDTPALESNRDSNRSVHTSITLEEDLRKSTEIEEQEECDKSQTVLMPREDHGKANPQECVDAANLQPHQSALESVTNIGILTTQDMRQFVEEATAFILGQTVVAEDQTHDGSLDRTLIPNDDRGRVSQESIIFSSVISPTDPLGNEHLKWNDSSTSDSVATPCVVTATVPKAVVSIASAAATPIKLNPITKNMRYNRSLDRKQEPIGVTSSTRKTVHFKLTQPREPNEKISEVRPNITPCYRTQWSSKAESVDSDPYDVYHINDDGDTTFEKLFPVAPLDKNQTAAPKDSNDSREALIHTLLMDQKKDFEVSSLSIKKSTSRKKRCNDSKSKPQKQPDKKLEQPKYELMGRPTIKEIIDEVLVEGLGEPLVVTDDSKDAHIQTLLEMTRKDFESPAQQTRNHRSKKRPKIKHQNKQSEYKLINKETLTEAMKEMLVTYKLKTTRIEQPNPTTDEKAVQTCVERVDKAVETPRKFPTGKSRKTTRKPKANVATMKNQLPEPDPGDKCDRDEGCRFKQTTLSQFVKDQREERPGGESTIPQPATSNYKQRADVIKKKEPYRVHVSYATTPSIHASPLSFSPTTDFESVSSSTSAMQHNSFFQRIDKLHLSPPDGFHSSETDEVAPSQRTGTTVRIGGSRYVCFIRKVPTKPAHSRTFDVGHLNDSEIYLEESLCNIQASLAEKIHHKTLRPLEKLYDIPDQISTDDIEKILMEDLDPCEDEDDDAEIDSGMDETIKPATINAIQYRHCSSAKGSQEPLRYSPGYSPIRFSETPIAECVDRMVFRSPIDSPARNKKIPQLRGNFVLEDF